MILKLRSDFYSIANFRVLKHLKQGGVAQSGAEVRGWLRNRGLKYNILCKNLT